MNTVLLQANNSGISQFVMLGGMAVIFYLFFIRPQQKKRKDLKKFIGELKKGNRVVTMGGIHGKITDISDETVTIDVDRGSKLTLDKSYISLEASKKFFQEKK